MPKANFQRTYINHAGSPDGLISGFDLCLPLGVWQFMFQDFV